MMKKQIVAMITLLITALGTTFAQADIQIKMYKTDQPDQGEFIGTVVAKDSPEGLMLDPNLKDLPPGLHGFHIHAIPLCSEGGNDAQGHLDPQETSHHLGPYNEEGHLGDLPPLYVNEQGDATIRVIAPKLSESEIHQHSLIIHSGGDNFADFPEPLGGGGERIACGVIDE